jgi:hypothetical protein
MAETRKGRKSQSDYRELIAKALISDRFSLEEFPVLSQLPAIERWATAHPHELLPRGKALQLLLARSVADVIAKIGDADDLVLRRIVLYLQLRYQQHQSVKAIAESWQCSTVHVWRTVGQRALNLVTERFLEVARSA